MKTAKDTSAASPALAEGAAPAVRRPRAKALRSAYASLLAEPRRFRFDAAVRILTRASKKIDPAEAMRFRAPPGLAYPSADITAIEPAADGHPFQVITPVIGLTGTAGVLPRLYTEVLTTALRNRSHAFHDFLGMLAHRTIAMFARAGSKYRINRAAENAAIAAKPEQDPVAGVLLALTGYATPNLAPRLAVGTEPLLHYAGFFAAHPRSAERLAGLVSDWLGRKVEVVQFVGAWLPLPADQRSSFAVGRRPGTWNRLGVDAAIGVRAWDPQARIILRIGPLDLAGFAALLPNRPGLQRLVSLVRAFLGFETGFAINPVIAGPEVPPLLLDRSADLPPRLGWNTWIPAPETPLPGIQRPDGDEAIFEAEIVEAEAFVSREHR
jgi:type VI secretion system protein ImpH